MTSSQHVYEVRRTAIIAASSDVLPFGRLWYGEPNAVSYAKFRSRSHNAAIRVFEDAGKVIATLAGLRQELRLLMKRD
jgi:hypothetical protein